jgi:hypothetical protein
VLCLHTAELMTAAVALYERMGFRRDPAFDFDAASHHGLGGARPVPVLSYCLDLSRHLPAEIDAAISGPAAQPTRSAS